MFTTENMLKEKNHQHVHPVIKDKNKMYSVTKDKTDNIYYSRKLFNLEIIQT